MKKFILVLFLTFFAFSTKVKVEKNEILKSGVRTSITQTAVSYLLKELTVELKKFLPGYVYNYDEDVYQEVDTKIGKVKANITEIEVMNMDFDDINITFGEGKTYIAFKGVSGKVTFDYKIKAPVGTSKGDGYVNFKIDFNGIVGAIEDSQTQKFSIIAEDFKLDIHKLDIKFNNAKMWLKGIVAVLGGQIKKQAVQFVEKDLPKLVKTQGEEYLNTFNFIQDLPEDMQVNSQINELLVEGSKGYAGMSDVAEFLCKKVPAFHTIESPHDLPHYYGESSFVQIALDQFVFNSAFYSGHHCGLISYVLNKDQKIPEEFGFNLTTSSFKTMNIMPELFDVYGEQDLEIRISSMDIPKMTVKPEKVYLDSQFRIEILIKGESVLSFQNVAQFDESVQIDRDVIMFALAIDQEKNTLEKSSFEVDFDHFDQWIQNTFMKNQLLPYLNKIGSEGIELTFLSSLGIYLKDTLITNNDGFLKIVGSVSIESVNDLTTQFLDFVTQQK